MTQYNIMLHNTDRHHLLITTADSQQLGFSSSNLTFSSLSFTVSVPVICNNCTNQVTAVAVSQENSAIQGFDYSPINQLLVWNSSTPSTQYITFNILPNAFMFRDRSFQINLVNITGISTLGAISTNIHLLPGT